MNASQEYQKILQDNKESSKGGSFSICSTQKDVILAGLRQAKKENSIVTIESTCNQVNQFGGYTGMTPKDFVSYVINLAKSIKFDTQNILFGGDHLGPNVWKNLDSELAMKYSVELIENYVKAGYKKIHLDCSMPLKDDNCIALDDEIVSKRAAILCEVAENTYKKTYSNASDLIYVIGTEVPVPGGATESEDSLAITPKQRIEKTLSIHKNAFLKKGLQDAWERVCAIVVQPGVEFGDDFVFDYNPEKTSEISKYILTQNNIVYEAHSTDYQTPQALKNLVSNHFAILKVGPELTFAYREALFALEHIEKEMIKEPSKRSQLTDTILFEMLDKPKDWEKYYHGNISDKLYACKYSMSDRVRYYWDHKNIQDRVSILIDNLEKDMPYTLLSQYAPEYYTSLRLHKVKNGSQELIDFYIQKVMQKYYDACKI